MDSMQVTSDLTVYKLDASRCDLHIGDQVSPGLSIGLGFDTGSFLQAETYGKVESIHFSGADHALVIVIRHNESQP